MNVDLQTQRTKGLWIGMVGIAIWSLSGVIISYIIHTYGMAPLTLAMWRNFFVVVALVLGLGVYKPIWLRLSAQRMGFYVAYGLVLALFNTIWTISLRENGAAVATVLGYSSAGFTAIIAYFLFREQITPSKAIAIVLSLSGCVMVANALDPVTWALKPAGVITGLLSGVIFSVYTLFGKHGARLGVNVWTSMFASFPFGTIFIFIFNCIPGFPGSDGFAKAVFPILPTQAWQVLIGLAFGPTLLGFGLYNLSMDYLPATIANLLATTEPVMTALEAYVWLGERMTLTQIIGSLVILSAVFLIQGKE